MARLMKHQPKPVTLFQGPSGQVFCINSRARSLQVPEHRQHDIIPLIPCRLVAGALLILLLVAALVSSHAERKSTGQFNLPAGEHVGSARFPTHDHRQAPAGQTSPAPPPAPWPGHREHRHEAPVPPFRLLGLRTPVVTPPPQPGRPHFFIAPLRPSPPPSSPSSPPR